MTIRKGNMTNKERVEALLRREKPDRVPLWPFSHSGFDAVNCGFSIAEMYNNLQKALNAQRTTCEQYDWVFIPTVSYGCYGGWEFGGEIKWPSSEFSMAPMVVSHPVKTDEDVWKLTIPDVRRAGIVPYYADFYKLAGKERLDNQPFNILAKLAGPFTTAGNICGTHNLCKWLIKKPDVANRLLRMATDHLMQLASYWKELFGIEGVLAYSYEPTATNQLISAKHFEKFAFPYLKEISENFLSLGYKHIFYHICGDQNGNLPYWAEIPMGDPGIASIGHEVDIEIAAKCFPNDIILGNINTTVMQMGTPEEMYETTKNAILKGKKCPGGFILSPGCDMPPKTPPINVQMMTKAVNDFGWYE